MPVDDAARERAGTISCHDHPVVDLDGDASQGLRRRFEGKDEAPGDWALDPECYTLAQVANLLRTFLSKEKAAAYAGEV